MAASFLIAVPLPNHNHFGVLDKDGVPAVHLDCRDRSTESLLFDSRFQAALTQECKR
jgi:hypothetical protein